MKKALHKLSVRLQEEDIVTIKKYPGENISEKVRSLLAVHNTLIEDTEGKDLPEKYETILKNYLEEYVPDISLEVCLRRKELRRYRDTLEEMERLQQLVDELREDIFKLRKKSGEYLEQKVADCVVIQKEKKNIK